MLALLLLIASIFLIPAKFELYDVDLLDHDMDKCDNAKNYEACLKEAVEKQRGGTYDNKVVIIWSGIGTRGNTNMDGGNGGSDELLIRVHHIIHAIPVASENEKLRQSGIGKQNRQAIQYDLVSIISYWNNAYEIKKIGVGNLDAFNNLNVNSESIDQDEEWDEGANNNNDENQKFGACTESSDYAVQMCSWAKVTLSSKNSSAAENDDGQPRRVVKICTGIYSVQDSPGKRQRVLPMLGCITLDDICLMEVPGCAHLGAAATFTHKNAKMPAAGKTEL